MKVPDGPKQLGFVGFFYPTSAQLDSGAYTSVFPSLGDPLLTLNVYTGDLGLDEGTPKSVYVLVTTTMTQVTGGKTGVDSIELKVGDTQQLPDNLGSVSLDSVKRFASFDIHHDPTQGWVLIFAILVVAGLLTSLFIPRRRLWVKVREDSEGETVIEYAALARGDDPGLETALKEFADEHSSTLDTPKT